MAIVVYGLRTPRPSASATLPVGPLDGWSNEACETQFLKHRLAHFAGGGEVHLDLPDPIIEVLQVHEHLLDASLLRDSQTSAPSLGYKVS